jgi:hypothetical protein
LIDGHLGTSSPMAYARRAGVRYCVNSNHYASFIWMSSKARVAAIYRKLSASQEQE